MNHSILSAFNSWLYNDDIRREEDDASSWDSLKTEDEEEPTSAQVEILKGKSIQEIVLF
jgi:hypothetical protein